MYKIPLALMVLLLSSNSAAAASFDDPEWPCIQRKVPTISTAQMWVGPEITEPVNALGKQREIAAVAARLALRRVEINEAEQLIEKFAEEFDENKNESLTALFARTFTLIANERKTIMNGIGRYAKKQSNLSKRIEERRAELAILMVEEPENYDKLEELQDFLEWDERIFRERAQSLTYVCETPIILEQRIFSISRAIQLHLDR